MIVKVMYRCRSKGGAKQVQRGTGAEVQRYGGAVMEVQRCRGAEEQI